MRKIRVLAVDDSVVVRRVITEVLDAEPDFEVVGVAANGKIALAKIPQVAPDVVILDLDMPVMDGLATLEHIRKSYPRIPVLMFSALTERGAEATLDALFRGATDYVTKPAKVGSADQAAAVVRDQLIPKIRIFCGHVVGGADEGSAAGRRAAHAASAAVGAAGSRVDVVAVGASTGGPNALQVALSELPRDFPVPVLVVQHMPPIFTKFLARQLAAKLRIDVQEASSGAEAVPGRVLIAPGGNHMVVTRDGNAVRVATNQDPPENSCRPAVDVLFRSVADIYGRRSLAVILTGMGKDGLNGCEAIRRCGGQVIAQDQGSSVVWGMPGFVVNSGLADAVLSLERVGGEIVRRVEAGGRAARRRMAPSGRA